MSIKRDEIDKMKSILNHSLYIYITLRNRVFRAANYEIIRSLVSLFLPERVLPNMFTYLNSCIPLTDQSTQVLQRTCVRARAPYVSLN